MNDAVKLEASQEEGKLRDEADVADATGNKPMADSLRSVASRVAAIGHGYNPDPDAKIKVMYRNVNKHKVQTQGILPSNNQVRNYSYRSVNKTKLYGIGDFINNFRAGIDNARNSQGAKLGAFLNGYRGNQYDNEYALYEQARQDEFQKTGRDLSIEEFYNRRGLTPSQMNVAQRQFYNDISNPSPEQEQLMEQDRLNQLANHADYMYGKNIDPNKFKAGPGLSRAGRDAIYNTYYEKNGNWKGPVDMTREEFEEDMANRRNQILAEQVQNYNKAIKGVTEKAYKVGNNIDGTIYDKIRDLKQDIGNQESAINSGGLDATQMAIAKANLAKLQGELNSTQSKLTGYNRLMRQTSGFDKFGTKLTARDDKGNLITDNGANTQQVADARLENLRQSTSESITRSKAEISNIEKQLADPKLSEEKKAELTKALNSQKATVESRTKLLDKLNNSNSNVITDRYAYDPSVVNNIQSFQNATGLQGNLMEDPDTVQKKAQADYDSARRDAENRWKQLGKKDKHGNLIKFNVNDWEQKGGRDVRQALNRANKAKQNSQGQEKMIRINDDGTFDYGYQAQMQNMHNPRRVYARTPSNVQYQLNRTNDEYKPKNLLAG